MPSDREVRDREIVAAMTLLRANGYSVVGNSMVENAKRFLRHHRICYWMESRRYLEAQAAGDSKAENDAFEMMDYYLIQYMAGKLPMEAMGFILLDMLSPLSATEQASVDNMYQALEQDKVKELG